MSITQTGTAIAEPKHAVPAAASHLRGRRWAVGAVIVLVVLAAAGALAWSVLGTAAIQYATTPISKGPVTRTVTATGTVNPVLTIIVGSYISGVIQTVSCDYNTPVKQGQVCAKIDPRPYQSVVDQNQANLDIARAQLAKDQAMLVYAKANTARNASLAARSFTPQDTADNAKSAYDQAVAQVALDQASIELRQALLDAAKINLGYTDIVAAVDGTVVSRNVTQGQTVAATFQTPTLFLIASDLTKMQVDTNVSESDIGLVKQGGKAAFTVDAYAGRVFVGTVIQVRQSPQTVQNVVTYDVVVSVDNADLALKPGMTASTQIIIDARTNVLRVPDQAVRYAAAGKAQADKGAAYLWLLRNGEKLVVPVMLGLDDDSFTEIVSGDLRPDDLAITGEQTAPAMRATTTPRL